MSKRFVTLAVAGLCIGRMIWYCLYDVPIFRGTEIVGFVQNFYYCGFHDAGRIMILLFHSHQFPLSRNSSIQAQQTLKHVTKLLYPSHHKIIDRKPATPKLYMVPFPSPAGT